MTEALRIDGGAMNSNHNEKTNEGNEVLRQNREQAISITWKNGTWKNGTFCHAGRRAKAIGKDAYIVQQLMYQETARYRKNVEMSACRIERCFMHCGSLACRSENSSDVGVVEVIILSNNKNG